MQPTEPGAEAANRSRVSEQDAAAPASEERDVEFFKMQFGALREEILGLRVRIIQLLTVTLTGIPLFLGAVERFDLDPAVFAIPVITVVFALMILYEQNSLMRAGRYIREKIEPALCTAGTLGWECFRETDPDNRRAERLFSYAAYIAFSVYYFFGVGLGLVRLADWVNGDLATFGATAGAFVAYGIVFVFASQAVVRNFPVGSQLPRNRPWARWWSDFFAGMIRDFSAGGGREEGDGGQGGEDKVA